MKKKLFKLNSYQRWLGLFLITASALGVIIKGFSAVDSRYQKVETANQIQKQIQENLDTVQKNLEKVSERLDNKMEKDDYNSLRERLWDLEKEYGTNLDKIKDPLIQKEIKELKDELELWKEKFKEKKETPK